MARRESERFSTADAAWLHMDRPVNRMVITGVLTFKGVVPYRELEKVIRARLLHFKRFRQRIKEPLLRVRTPHWEAEPDFKLSDHLHRVALPAPPDHEALQHFVGQVMSAPLDRSRSPWEWYLVENLQGGSALVVRLHHCIADGIALVRVLLSLTDTEASAETAEPAVAVTNDDSSSPGPLRPLARAVRRTYHAAGSLWAEGRETLDDPYRLLDAALVGASGTRAFGKLVLTLPDHRTVLRGKCSGTKRAAWCDVLTLREVKRVAKASGGTVNDILLAAVTGALRRYLIKRGEDLSGVDIRAMVPVNLRPPEEPLEKLGNRFGLVILSLPVGADTPERRLRILKRRMDQIKKTPEAVVAFGILESIGLTPAALERYIVDIFASKVSAVMTNVPGPREQLYLAGAPIKGMMFWVPTGGNIGLGVSILSYAGKVTLGIMTDNARVPDPGALIAAFVAEFEEMKNRARPKVPVRARRQVKRGRVKPLTAPAIA